MQLPYCCCYRRLSWWVNRKCTSRRTFFPFGNESKMSAVFRNSCLSQSGGIDDAKVSDRQRRFCAPWRNIISCKSSFTCHVPLGFCLRSCWVQFKVRSLSFSDNDSVLFGTCNQVQLSIYFSSVFHQSGFWLHSLENLLLIVVLHITLWFKRHRLGIVQTVDLLNMMQLMHILSRFKQDTYHLL